MINPELINPIAFAQDKTALEGTFVLSELDERVSSHEYLSEYPKELEGHYQLVGGCDRQGRCFLELSLELDLNLVCQRCLVAFPFQMKEKNRIYLFLDEATLDEAMMLDDELEGIVTEEELSIQSLVEDEILISLLFPPKHEHCDNPDLERINQDKPNHFSILSDLK